MKHYLTLVSGNILTSNKINMILDNSVSIKEKNDYVSLDDELIQYISNSLNWVDSIVEDMETEKGLPYYSDSIIDFENMEKLKQIFTAWKSLFNCAPLEIKKVDYYDENKKENVYKYLNRNEFINDLSQAIDLIDLAQKKRKYIMYEGI